MAGDFSSSSHCELWLKDRDEVDRAHLRLAEDVFGSLEGVGLFFEYFIGRIQEITHAVVSKGDQFRQQIAATAVVYFRRLYFIVTPADLQPCVAATACILLSYKTEEFGGVDIKRLTSIAMKKFGDLWLSADPSHPHASFYPPNSPIHFKLVIETEFAVLHILRCSTIVFQPYRPLREYCRRCADHLPSAEDQSNLLRFAWMVVNDTLHTDASLIFSPNLIALAAMFLAASSKNISIMPWFAQNNVPRHKIAEAVQLILDYYESSAKRQTSRTLDALREEHVFAHIRRLNRDVDWDLLPPPHPQSSRPPSSLHA